MDIVFSQDPRDFARRDWSALVTADPAGTVFHTPAFLKLYWEEFADLPDHLLLAFAEEDGDQVGAVAFERLDRTLRFLGGTEVTDYMGPVGLPEVRPTVAKELFAALARTDDWTEADLRGLAEDQAWLGLLTEAAAAQGFATEVLDDQNGVAPVPPAPGIVRRVPGGPAGEAPSRDQAQGPPPGGRGRPLAHLPGHPRDARGVPRPVRRAPSHQRGPEGRLHAAGDGDLLPPARRRVPPARDLQPDVHRDGGASEARGLDRLPVRRHLLAVQLGVRSRRISPCRPGWCSWPRTSASRSRPGVRRSTC